jgi:NADH:ubiquinone oxidoreductase 27 kD subunit
MMDLETILAVGGVKVREGAKDSWRAFDCEPNSLYALIKLLMDEYYFDALADLCAIDMGEDAAQRFGCVYHLFSNQRKRFIRVVAMCESNEKPKLPTLTKFFHNADWHEREAYDMMGILFDGHPNLTRVLMWDAYTWFPLRKDFPLAGKDAPIPETYGGTNPMKVEAAPMEGGPFHSMPNFENSSDREPRSREEV